MNSRSSTYAIVIMLAAVAGAVFLFTRSKPTLPLPFKHPPPAKQQWEGPDTSLIPATEYGNLIKYGRALITNTSYYLGPNGIVAKMSNGLTCQNCHIKAGTRLYANSFATVASSYPKYRDRSGRLETIAFRINECMERSMNGAALDSASKEMKALIAYLQWVGKDVTTANRIPGMETLQLPFMDRAADTIKGKAVYTAKCTTCHGENGEGKAGLDSSGYAYPPLWGPHSYNVSSGMYRLARLAPFIKYNMPYSVAENKPQLSNEDAWDVAAYISSRERPRKFFSYDWKKKYSKPVDYPFGPFDDTFSAIQHKYGPFKEMQRLKDLKKQSSPVNKAALMK